MIQLKFTFTSALRTGTRTFYLVLLAALAGCVTQGPATRPTDVQALEARARAAEQGGNLAAAADLYAELASGVTGTLRTGYLLESARLLANQGDAALARRRLGEARGGASAEQQKTITVLLARLEVRDRRPQAALDLLGTLQPPLTTAVQSEGAAIRGQALFQLGRHVDAVRTLVEREVWLENGNDILANQRLIWDGFREFPVRGPLAPTGDRVVDGWLALAPLATRATDADLPRELLAWRQTYTDHPAGRLLADMLSTQRSAGFPAQVALLLPLSSPQRTQALAIRDGFIAAHLERGGDHATTVRVYDTTQLGSQQAYMRAQLEADFIVGPLLRPEVDQVIAQAGFVPTLALNFAQTETPSLGSFYQFALAPADEARVIAASAAGAGAATAIAFVPSNQRGYGILDSFRTEFEAQGGRLLDFVGYDPAIQDFGQQIAALFNITRSTQRQRRLAANLGVPIDFEPRLRQDVDAIFIAADSRTARLLMPQLRSSSVGNIPTYATSEIINNPISGSRDTDLNGLIFPDVPAVLTPNDDAAMLRRDVQSYWPQRASEIRLYSMGYDAYELIAPLYTGSRTWPFRGLSGELSLDSQGRIRRDLPLAQIRNGRPVAIESSTGSGGASSELVGGR